MEKHRNRVVQLDHWKKGCVEDAVVDPDAVKLLLSLTRSRCSTKAAVDGLALDGAELEKPQVVPVE